MIVGQDALEHGRRRGETIVLLHGATVAAWSWQPQVERLANRHVLTPDLPGFGARDGEPWPGIDGAVRDIASVIEQRAAGGRAHVVGLSLGGVVALHLAARAPHRVRTLLISGVAADGVSAPLRVMARLQAPLWDRAWYWRSLARAYGLDGDDVDAFTAAGLRLGSARCRALMRELTRLRPPDLSAYRGRLLAVAGAREPRDPVRAFRALRRAAPQTETWVAPRLHHQWSVEDPDTFTAMVRAVADGEPWPPEDAAQRP